MWIFFRFISGIYLKNFFLIFFALLIFYCGIDLLINFKNLSGSANLNLLYVAFLSFSAFIYILPISLIFALIVSLITMIRNNEFVSFFALGLSKNLVIIFPFLWALFFCCVYVGLNFTSFAYANDYKSNILKNGTLTRQGSDVFLKFNDQFVYISKFQNEQNSLLGVKIFNIKDLNLSSYILAKQAIFENKIWTLREGNISELPKTLNLQNLGLKRENFEYLQALVGFKPKIIENVASSKAFSISDILESFIVFKKQGINVNALKISLYKLVFVPFFAPFLMLIMYYFFPVIARFFNLAFVAFIACIFTFFVWGSLFLLVRLCENGVLFGEMIIVPIFILAFIAFFIFLKKA